MTTRIVHVRDGRADVYPGGFRDFDKAAPVFDDASSERGGRRAAQSAGGGRAKDANANGSAHANAKTAKDAKDAAEKDRKGPDKAAGDEASKQKYEAQRQGARAAEKKKRRIQELETEIAAGERDLDTLRGKLKEAPGDDWEKLASMARDEQVLAKKVDSMLMEWARLSEEAQ